MRVLSTAVGATLAAAVMSMGFAPAAQASTVQDTGIECQTSHAAFKRCLENNGRTWRLNVADTQSNVIKNTVNDVTMRIGNGRLSISVCGTITAPLGFDFNLSHITVGQAKYSGSDLCPGEDQRAADALVKALSNQYIPVKPYIGRLELNTDAGLLAFTS